MNSDSKQKLCVGDLVQFQAVPSAEPLLGVIVPDREIKPRLSAEAVYTREKDGSLSLKKRTHFGDVRHQDPADVLVRWQDGTQNRMSQSRISLLAKAQQR